MSMQGVKFNDIHSYYDLHLILSQCIISPATPKTNYIDIPGGDGTIDLTEALGDIKYNDRTGKLVFTVLPSAGDFEEKKSEISNLLNGKVFNITLDKDPDFYYIGRCSISDWKCDKRIGQITVDLKLQPFKYAQNETVSRMYTTPHIITIKGLPVVSPTIYCSTDFYICVNGASNRVYLNAGTHKYSGLVLNSGENQIVSQGGMEIIFTYRERSL